MDQNKFMLRFGTADTSFQVKKSTFRSYNVYLHKMF